MSSFSQWSRAEDGSHAAIGVEHSRQEAAPGERRDHGRRRGHGKGFGPRGRTVSASLKR